MGALGKRKQSFSVEAQKVQAKRQTDLSGSSYTVCKSCKQQYHSTVISKDCPNHMLSTDETLESNLGYKY